MSSPLLGCAYNERNCLEAAYRNGSKSMSLQCCCDRI